jgi:hypothetical protein
MVVHERFRGPIVRVRILEPGPQSGCAPGRPGKESSKLPGVGGVLDRVLKQTVQCGRFSKDPTLRLSDADITEAQINQFVFLQQEVGFAALCLDVIVVAHLYGIDLTDAQARRKVVIDFVLTELPLKAAQLRFGINHYQFHACDLCEILHVLCRDTIAVAV